MKERILTGWTFQRALYLVMGGMIISQAIAEQQWLLVIFGGYFASMGLFAFGCASGNCYTPNIKTPANKAKVQDITYEEIKS
jgi:hypothetical protein